MKVSILRVKLRFHAIALAGVIGLAGPASTAFAEGGQARDSQSKESESSAASKPPASVSGVVVQPAPKPNKIPPAKRAALDAEANKRKAWQNYRNATTPASAPGRGAPGVTASEQTGNYPGLRTLPSH